MAGANISQRNTLTINNGAYYLDTTVSADMQKSKDKFSNDPPVAFNVFAPGKQYHVFFVYAKQSTKQTYQIWVGPGFDKDKHFELTNVNVETQAFSFLPKVAKTPWATASYDGKGLLTVEVDFNGLTTLDPTPDNGLCAPRTFCKVDGQKMCVSNLSPADRLFGESDAVCRNWAVKDLDCPPLVYENRNGTPTWVSGGCPASPSPCSPSWPTTLISGRAQALSDGWRQQAGLGNEVLLPADMYRRPVWTLHLHGAPAGQQLPEEALTGREQRKWPSPTPRWRGLDLGSRPRRSRMDCGVRQFNASGVRFERSADATKMTAGLKSPASRSDQLPAPCPFGYR